jgi:hypothetical protein
MKFSVPGGRQCQQLAATKSRGAAVVERLDSESTWSAVHIVILESETGAREERFCFSMPSVSQCFAMFGVGVEGSTAGWLRGTRSARSVSRGRQGRRRKG